MNAQFERHGVPAVGFGYDDQGGYCGGHCCCGCGDESRGYESRGFDHRGTNESHQGKRLLGARPCARQVASALSVLTWSSYSVEEGTRSAGVPSEIA